VERPGGHHDPRLVRWHPLDLVPPLARGLDRRLHGLGAGVHGQHHLGADQPREPLGEGVQQVVLEGPRRQSQPIELGVRDRRQPGVPVPEVQRRVPGEEVQVAVSFDVADPRAVAGVQHDVERVVVRGEARATHGDDPGRLRRAPSSSTASAARRRRPRPPARQPLTTRPRATPACSTWRRRRP